MQASYSPLLVVLSVLTAIIASFVALNMASHVTAARTATKAGQQRKERMWLWLAGGSVAMGSGIWSMHFVGMLAFSLPIPLAYNVSITLASWVVAVLSSMLALITVSRPRLAWRQLGVAGMLMGVGVASMHYLGMEAMQMMPRISYDPLLFALSVLIAIVASTAALKICFLLRGDNAVTGLTQKAAAALVMGLAIAGMHYTGMAAANFPEGSVCTANDLGIWGARMGIAISAVVAVFFMVMLLVSVYHAMAPTILNRLAFLVFASIVPVSLLVIGVMAFDYHRLHQQQERELVSAARAVMTAVDHELANIKSGMEVLSTSRMLQGGNLRDFHGQARDSLAALNLSAIVLESADGQTLMDTQRTADSSLSPTPQQRQQPGTAERTDLAALSPYLEDAGTITVSVPLSYAGGQVLRARFAPSILAHLITEKQLSSQWIISVYDGNGYIAARSHDMERYVGRLGLPGIIGNITRNTADAFETVTREGTPVLMGSSRSAHTGWAVGVGIPSASLRAPLLDAAVWLLAGLTLILLVSLLLAWRISRGISSSVQSLVQPALALGDGASINVPPLALAEADQVGRALSQASILLDATRHEAYHDPLTGLANRAFFRQMLRKQITLAERNSTGLAVLYIDLDGFKAVNDTHGHDAGDLLLQEAAQRLAQGVRACDLVARLGGDEFAIALIQPGARGAAKVAAKLVEHISQPYHCGEHTLHVSASIGATNYLPGTAPHAGAAEALLKQADVAMYHAKQTGKRRVVMADYVPADAST